MRARSLVILLLVLPLAGCGSLVPTTPPPLPTVVLGDNGAAPGTSSLSGGGGVVASGTVVPAVQAQVASALAGKVDAVNVAVGDQVEAGQVLVALAGAEKLAAAVEAADLEVLNAQQALKDLQDSTAMAAAQAQLAVANAQDTLTKAQNSLNKLAHPDLSYYQDQFNRAQAALTAARQNAEITDFETNLRAAKDALETATNDLNKYKDLEARYPGYGQQHGNVLENAQKAYDRALQDYQSAQYRLEQAQSNDANALTDAQKAYDTAKANLSAAQAGPDPVKLAVAQANVAIAQAALAEAQTHYAEVKAGPDPDQLTLAQARLTSAEAQQAAAKSALEDLELRAPFAGTVTEVHIHVSEWVTPGQPLLLLTDLESLHVETTDLSERDVPKIEIGQPVIVLIKALQQEVTGRVSDISPLASTLGGDVVYRTTVDLDTRPAGLRAGMSVDVQFEVGP